MSNLIQAKAKAILYEAIDKRQQSINAGNDNLVEMSELKEGEI